MDLPLPELIALATLLFAAAMLYSSVGHAGASAYLAAMALLGVAPAVMKPTALALNICVASFVSLRYYRAGLFSGRIAWPFILGSVPLAFFGGSLQLPGQFYKPLVGVVLLIAAARLWWQRLPNLATDEIKAPHPAIAVFCGAALGLLSGLTGTGGGIFLSPLLIFMRWTETRTTLGIASVFILCNSIAGLAGNLSAVGHLPSSLPWLILAVMAGALLGSELGVNRLKTAGLLKALGGVLMIAGVKLVFA
jgi:uncharacterized membrane protein YfcA